MSHATAADYFKPQRLFTRTDWGASPPKKKQGFKGQVKWVVVKSTLTNECLRREDCEQLIKEIQRQDMEELGHTDIQYSFLISSDGTMYEGRGWDTVPDPYPINETATDNNINETSVLIGMIGDPRDAEATSRQELSVLNILGDGVQKEMIHDDVKFLREHDVGYDELEIDEEDEEKSK